MVFNEVKVNEKYSIALPDYLKPAAELHDQASLQYKNEEQDFYTIVIDESKKEMIHYDLDYDLELYFKNIASSPFLKSIQGGTISNPVKKQINGYDALISEITGSVHDTMVYYRLCVIETKNNFYQLLIWTRADSKEKILQDINKIMESFKELPSTSL